MMVSTVSVVFPVERSPMINSRCPRPIGMTPSMALMPVCTGLFTLPRVATFGATRSIALVFSALTGPFPSSGRPSGSTTRPNSAFPTGTSAILPVHLTSSPSLSLL